MVDWEYAGMGDRYFDLANFAVNNELGEAGELALLEAYFAEPADGAAGRDPAADEVHVGLPRGDVGRGPDGALRARLRLRRATRAKHFDRMLETAAHRDFETWLSEAREPAG